jgi:hypothetical protein
MRFNSVCAKMKQNDLCVIFSETALAELQWLQQMLMQPLVLPKFLWPGCGKFAITFLACSKFSTSGREPSPTPILVFSFTAYFYLF